MFHSCLGTASLSQLTGVRTYVLECFVTLCKLINCHTSSFVFRVPSYSRMSGLLDTGTVSGSKIISEVS